MAQRQRNKEVKDYKSLSLDEEYVICSLSSSYKFSVDLKSFQTESWRKEYGTSALPPEMTNSAYSLWGTELWKGT